MNEYEIITFKIGDEEMEILFSKKENTVWLTREDIAGIFNISVSTTRRMLKQFEHNEHYKSYFRSFLNITTKRKAIHYNLQILLLIGEKLESSNGLELKRYVDEYIAESDDETKIDGNEIVTYSNDGVHLNVNLSRKEDTVWLTQKQICILYQTSKSNVSEHIFNILQDKEVDVNSVVRNFRTTQSNGKYYAADFYNLDMILSIGYRVRTTKAVEFRKWATSKLKKFIYANQASNNNTSMVVRDEFNHLYDFVNEMNKRLMEVEKNQKEETLDKIIVEDSRFDALVMMDSLISKANEIIVLIDGYVDIYTLDMFRNKKKEVKLVIATNEHHYKLSEKNIELFKNQCGELTIIFDNKVHDRFLIIDHKRYYHLGASMNYYGKYMSQITEETKESNIKILKDRVDSYNI